MADNKTASVIYTLYGSFLIHGELEKADMPAILRCADQLSEDMWIEDAWPKNLMQWLTIDKFKAMPEWIKGKPDTVSALLASPERMAARDVRIKQFIAANA